MKKFTVLLALALMLPFAQAKAGFGTGLAVGYLFGSSDNKTIVNNMSPEVPYDQKLYDEYKRNETLIAKGVENSSILEQRNTQIAQELVEHARQDYIDAFYLDLKQISSEIIESQSLDNDTPMRRIPGAFGIPTAADHFDAHRNRIRFQLQLMKKLGNESSQIVDDLDIVSVNDRKAEHIGTEWFYTYDESWGNNAIKVVLQDKKSPGLRFSLQKNWDVVTAANARDAAIQDVASDPDTYLSVFKIGGSVLFILVMVSFFYPRKA